MNDREFQSAYEAENRRDQIVYSNLATVLSVILNLSCSVMDYYLYRDLWKVFLEARLFSMAVVIGTWIWFNSPLGRNHYRVFGVMWYASPLAMILWMIYACHDPVSPYYAGLNIILLAVGLLSPWTYLQNFISAFLVIISYILICFDLSGAGSNSDALKYLVNNTTFLFLTATIVVGGSVANERQRRRTFSLRYELDQNRKSLEENNRKLVELDRLKSRFFANVSHELRTPLTLLIAPLEVLIQKFTQSMDENSMEMLQTMRANGMRLLKLINDLLELTRLESGRLEIKPEPLAVDEFVSGIASAVRQMARQKHITLETHADAELGAVMADRDKLEKIVLNLLFNALKFTPAEGRVWLRAEKKDGDFLLVVGDTGVGIAEKSLPYVFDRFWQEDGSAKRKFQGVGIGLALVKELTQAMNGTVAVESQLGKGTKFTIKLAYVKAELPEKPAGAGLETPSEPVHSDEWLANLYRRAELFPGATIPQQAKAAGTSYQRRTQRPLLLVADDEPDMRRFLVSQLVDDYEVVEAVDGKEAAEKAQDIMPDLILLDWMMPHKDGLQVCRELRDYAPTSSIPIILLTARADEEAKYDALQMGANDFLSKPFSSNELQARIKNLIESHHAQRKLTKQNRALSEAIEQIKETEMQLVQSEKLSSLGRMSAGIIHEINNPLNFSMTGLFTLRNKGKKLAPEDRTEYDAVLNDIEEGLKRVRNIVSDLRTFTHPGVGDGEPVEAADAANAAIRFLGGEWKDHVEIHQEIPESQALWANRNNLIHVLVNLIQNAIDAIGEKQFAAGEKPQIWLRGEVQDDRSLIIVRDNGPGIDPKIMNKIFDPFFTTKDVGKGMGLGLSICYRIVQGYGGTITAKSERGQYCEFTLNFPANADAAVDTEIEHGEPVRL